MVEKRTLKFIIILFAIVGIAGYFSGLFIDVTRDAGKYATAAKEIFQHGNFINLTVHGEAYEQKPPLLFWLGAIGFTVGDITNFWFKFPVFILVMFGIYWAFKLGESLYNKKTGIITAVLLFTSFVYALYTMDIHTDTPLQAFITLALWQFSEFLKFGKTRNAFWGFFAVGLAMLSKGPIGAAIPAFAVVGHIILKKKFRQLKDYRWYLGILFSFIILFPALIGLLNQFGWKGIHFFFWENIVGRVTGSYVEAAKNDPTFYIHNLIYQLLPWSLLFLIVAFLEVKQLVKNRFQSVEYFTFTGIWIYFIILSLAESQLPNYIFSIIPLMAVLISKWILIAVEQNNHLFKLFFTTQNVVISIVWAFILLLLFYLFPFPPVYIWVILLLGIISTLYILRKEQDKLMKLLVPSVIVSVCFIFVMNTHVFKYIFSFQAPPKAARYFTEYASANDKLYNYRYEQYELFFYSEPEAIQLHNSAEMKSVSGKKGNWIFTNEKGFAEIEKLEQKPDTVIKYRHLYLNRGGRFINPETRNDVLQNMYLVKF